MANNRPQTLFEKYDTVAQGFVNFKKLVSADLEKNLAFPLREYQKEAIGRQLYYTDSDPNKKNPTQLLFNMATGSGKTLVMAASILDLYQRGRRNFIFFVNSKNIIEKTRDNFLNPGSSKYLFAKNLLIEGEKVMVREVDNFSDSDPKAINIIFTTIQGLHTDLKNPHENRLTYDEIAEQEIVMIGDEAHHNNTATMLSKEERDNNTRWEDTVNNIMKTAKKPILLEFTATIDLDDANIFQKYFERIIYKYDLKAFRLDGYSKDPLIYSVDVDILSRCLQAIIISQYRKKVALKNGVWLKPVVMFKSRTIAESGDNFEAFVARIKSLTADDLTAQKRNSNDILKKAFDFFNDNGITIGALAEELKQDFSEERLILVDGNNVSGEKQLILNSLEDRKNEIRAVFAVDMLNEGWDVLNLFDIVRLYDTRDAKANKPGKTTLREAQLIGRGARYFPFVLSDDERRFQRKFDENENSELRVIEQLHYHSAHNPKYIQEIRQALIQTGLIPATMVEREMKLKASFKKTKTYIDGVVWSNERFTRAEARHKQIKLIEDEYELSPEYSVDLPSGIGREIGIFSSTEDGTANMATNTTSKEVSIGWNKDIAPNVVRAAISRNKAFNFDRLERSIPGLAGIDAFISLLGKVRVVVNGRNDEVLKLSQEQKLFIMSEVLTQIESKFKDETERYIGTETFKKAPLREVFKDVVKRKYSNDENSDAEFGMPQLLSRKYGLNLESMEWYAYDENFGTSEEKSFAKTMSEIYDDLAKKWDDIYLLRNEKAVMIYDFDEGRTFEPDFLLFANDKTTGNISWQIFIEPKGGQFLDSEGTFTSAKEGWKEKFLQEIESKFNGTVLKEDENWRLVGLPFYNEENTKTEIVDVLKNMKTA